MNAKLEQVRGWFSNWRFILIVVWLVVQLVAPLSYYAGRRDPHDERFAWRMFSPMRMAKCAPQFTIDGKPLAIESEFHEAWKELADRGRFVVIEAMAARLCAKHPDSNVTVTVDCTYLDRKPATYGGFNMCQVPLL